MNKQNETFQAAIAALMTAVQLRGDFPDENAIEILDECAEIASARAGVFRDDTVRVMKTLLRDEEARVAIGRLAYMNA